RTHTQAPRDSPNGIYGISAAIGALLGLDVGRPDHFAPLLGLVGDELAKIGGRARKQRAAQVSQPRLDFGIGHRRRGDRVKRRNFITMLGGATAGRPATRQSRFYSTPIGTDPLVCERP